MPDVHIGSVFNLYGSWKLHPKYGLQFYFQDCIETLPAAIQGLKNELKSKTSALSELRKSLIAGMSKKKSETLCFSFSLIT